MDWPNLTLVKDIAMLAFAVFMLRDLVLARRCKTCGKRHT